MAITTYAELQAAAANWLVRGDLTARIPEFIALAEARLNRVLRIRLSETDVALNSVAGSRSVPLPSNFAEPLAVWLVRAGGRERLPSREPAVMSASTTPGPPCAWGVDGATLVFDRPSDQSYALVLRMLTKFQLSEAAPTNALLSEGPDAYLFATLCEAGPFLRDAELANAFEARLERAIGEINTKAARSRAAGLLTVEAPARASAVDILRGA